MIKLKSIINEIIETYYDNMSDDEKMDLANSYFSIGHDGPDGEEPDKHYCWMWNGNDVIAKKGGNHPCNFGHNATESTFKGWYDTTTNTISVAFPANELRKLGDKQPTVDDIPQYLYSKLISKFGKRKPKFAVFENIQNINEGTLRGEWWFQDGQAIFADGDVGDVNHENVVIDTLRREILEDLGVDTSRYEYLPEISDLKDKIFQNIGDEFTSTELEYWNNDEFNEAIISYLTRKGDKDIDNKLYYIRGHDKRGRTLDAREYALVHWGWQRVKGNTIQTQTLTRKDLENIVSGLWEAYGEQLDETNEDERDEMNPSGEHTFNIEVMSTRSYYQNIPMSVLSKKDPTALNAYRTRY